MAKKVDDQKYSNHRKKINGIMKDGLARLKDDDIDLKDTQKFGVYPPSVPGTFSLCDGHNFINSD